MNLRPRVRDEPEINLVSLIDVVLMLVVFFMLSSTFLSEGRVRVRLPEASSTPVERKQTEGIVVTVTEQGGYRLNDRELINSSADTLRAAIVKEAGTDRSASVTIRADARSTHQAVVTAMDVLARLGFGEVRIATVQESPTGTP
jgi:biopolymer transport protein ExbD